MTFEEWMRDVDEWLLSWTSLSSSDLPDCCYRDWFDEGMSPRQAAREALAYAVE